MNRIINLVLALTMMVGAANAQNTMENVINKRQQNLAAIACLEAKGDQQRLAQALQRALDEGLTVSEAKEALSHLYAYTGFPRSLNALGSLQRVLADRQERGVSTEEGRDADPLPADYDALKQGTEVQTRLSGRPFDYTFAPATDYYLKAHLFGDIFARNNLSHADREVVTVSALSGLEGVMPQLTAHVNGARNMGVSDDALKALPTVLNERVGAPEALRLEQALATVFKQQPQLAQYGNLDELPFPKGELNTTYARYFIGNSYLAPLDAQNGGPVNVTFEPACRNNWHVHHKAVQVLVCVYGRGWYQEWGKPAVEMTPGTTIAIPEGVKHWHGAARDSWFQHVTYMTRVEDGTSTEWLEPVEDDVYLQLK